MKHFVTHPHWRWRFGRQVRNRRKRHWNPIPRLAKAAGVPAEQWHNLELGALRLTHEMVLRISQALGIGLDEVFTGNDRDFHDFIKATYRRDPATLGDEEASELYNLYQDIMKFKRERATAKKKKKKKKKKE